MKAVLVLCLLVFISCEKDIIDIGKCIYKAPKVKELITDAIIAIATKDFSKLWPKIKEALPDLIKIVIGCITEEKKVVEEPELKGWTPKKKCTRYDLYLCGVNCKTSFETDELKYKLCHYMCNLNCMKQN